MLVELIGLPTSGKTTLMKPLIEALRAQGFVADTVANIARHGMEQERRTTPFIRRHIERTSLFGAVRFGNMHPEIFQQLCDLEADPRHAYRNLEFLSEHYFATPYLDEPGLHFADEGLIHRGIATAIGTSDEAALRSYMATLPRKMICVHLDIPVRVALRRSQEHRGQLPFRKQFEGRRPVKVLKDAFWMTKFALEQCRELSIPVVQIDARAPMEESIAHLSRDLPDLASAFGNGPGRLTEARIANAS